jgi:hypothetical protein
MRKKRETHGVTGVNDSLEQQRNRYSRESRAAGKSQWMRKLAAVASIGFAFLSVAATQSAAAATRSAMTRTVLEQQGGYTRVGADTSTDPYQGDTTIDEVLPLLCEIKDGSSPPAGITFTVYIGWVQGSLALTSPIAGAALSSQAQGDAICASRFGTSWRMAEFHDGRYGSGFSSPGGWSFWGAGSLPTDTRFWVAISDQPADPWNSAGDLPPSNPVDPNYTKTVISTGNGWQLVQANGIVEDTQAPVSAQLYLTNGNAGLGNLPISQTLKDDLAADPEPDAAFVISKDISDEIDKSLAQGAPTAALIAYGEPETMSSAAGRGVMPQGIFGSCSDQDITKSKSFHYVPSFSNSHPIGGSNSGFTGTVTLSANGQIDGNGEVKISLKRTHIFWVCVPYGVKFRSAHVTGSVTLNDGATLSGTIKYSLPEPRLWTIAKPTLWSAVFMAGPIPVYVIVSLPISAGFDKGGIKASVTGAVTYNGGQNVFGTLDYTCTSSDCTGTSSLQTTNSGNQPVTASMSGRFQAALYAEVAIRGALYDDSFAYAQAGVRPYLLGDLWGFYGNNCGANLAGTFDTVDSLTFDLDWQLRVTATADTFLSSLWQKDLWKSSLWHIGFWDLLGGAGSTAMTPTMVGPVTVPANTTQTYGVEMRSCWPYTDKMNYTMNWGDGNTQALSGPATSVTATTHLWQNAGNPQLTLTALNDAHGRNLNKSSTNALQVTANQGHLGMTWRLLETNGLYAHVGRDAQTNPYNGDTSASTSLPILCLRQSGLAAPSGITFDVNDGWAQGDIALSAPVSGFSLTSRAVADNICATTVGAGYRMGEFHDGNGGWSWWGRGNISSATRFWVAINDQAGNPWN